MALVTRTDIFSESEWSELVRDLSLSPRQAQIIKLLLSGHSDKQIARELHIAVATVRTHLSRLFSRFDIEDRSELILYVFSRFRDSCRTSGCPHHQ